jgi:hypothetical protein
MARFASDFVRLLDGRIVSEAEYTEATAIPAA